MEQPWDLNDVVAKITAHEADATDPVDPLRSVVLIEISSVIERLQAPRTSPLESLPQTLRLALHDADSPDAVLATFLRNVVTAAADFCMIDLCASGGRMIRCAVMHADPEMQSVTTALVGGNGHDVTTSSALLHVGPLDDARLDAMGAHGDERHALRALGLGACASVPMHALSGALIGIATFGWSGDRTPSELEMQVVAHAVDTMSSVLDRALQQEATLATATGASRALVALAHDFRAPVQAIAAHLDLIERSDDVPRCNESVRKAAGHLLDMCADVTAHGLTMGVSAPVDACTVLQDVAVMMAPGAAAVNVSLRVVTPAHEIPLHTNRSALTRVLVNLLDDAILSSDGGEVVAGLRCSATIVTFELSGAGIDAQRCRRIAGYNSEDCTSVFDDAGDGCSEEQAARLRNAATLARSLGGSLTFSTNAVGGSITLRLTTG